MSYDLESEIHRIVANQTLHARWLNTFSYLEYTGFRKIVKSQSSNLLDSETLAHAVEEGRHALLLKKCAIKIGGAKFDSYAPDTLLCADQGVGYLQELDRLCDQIFSKNSLGLERSRLVYLCVTWLVEVRALRVYKIYQRVIEDFGINISLTGLLAEEDRHLASVGAELRTYVPDFEDRLAQAKALEENLYERYLSALVGELRVEDDPASVYA